MHGGLKIVIAEDNALVGMDMAELLGALGHHVCAMISTEAETVAAAARCHPDIMIVDSALGAGSGLAAMNRILAKGPMAYLFVADDPRAVLAAAPGAVVLHKLFSAKELETGIEKVCLASGAMVPHLPRLQECAPTCPFPTCFQRF